MNELNMAANLFKLLKLSPKYGMGFDIEIALGKLGHFLHFAIHIGKFQCARAIK